jgi:tetratricopeptide (TPR) repeat protein
MTSFLLRTAFVGALAALPPFDARVTSAQASSAVPDAAALRARGVELGFNLDYPEALAAFREAMALDPNDAASYRLAAATLWVNLLFDRGIITIDDYTGKARATLSRTPPPPDIAAAFRHYTTRAQTLAEQRIRERPLDAEGHFQAGAAASFQASFISTIEGRVLTGMGAGRRAYSAHRRCMELDPGRKDAGLVVGLYRYAVSTFPAPLRMLARVAGFDGGREEGLRLVEDAANHPTSVQSNARFSLVLLYNREGRHGDALRIIRQLQQAYPRNRLLWMEEGSTALRAGQPAEALRALDAGMAALSVDRRPRAFGEDARWRYYRGAALVALGRAAAADSELRLALANIGPEWIRGRAHLELGKLADLAGDRTAALTEYQTAHRICRAEKDADCLAAARQVMTKESRR